MNMTHEELFVKILNQMPFGVYCVDTDRKIFYWSKGAERISGYKAEDMLGKHCFESHLDHIDETGTHLCHAMCPLVATIFDGLSREKAVWLRSKEGDRVSVRVHTEPLFQNGKTLGAIEYFYKI
mgnify:FL=1